MSGLFTATLYGSNSNIIDENRITKKYVTGAELTALADLKVSLPIDISGYWGNCEIEIEERKLWNGGKLIKNSTKYTWELRRMPIKFSLTNAISFDEFYLTNIVNKKYKWLDLANYPYRPEAILNDFTKAIAVNVTGLSISQDNGNKQLTIQLTERP